MRNILLFALVVLVGCSSAPTSKINVEETPQVSNEAFKKEKTLKTSEVQDFYEGNTKALSPALQDETIDRFSKSELSQFSDETDPLLQLTVLCSEKDYDKAFKTASALFNRYQKVAIYWNAVANCHLNHGDYRKALLFYNKSLELKPNYVPALNNIGVMYVRQGQYQKALVAFERAYNQSKFSKTPRYNLAKLYLSYGLVELALPILNGLLSGSPSDVDLLNAVGSANFLRGNYDTALEAYNQISKDLWTNAEIGLNVAMTLKKLNRGGEARKVFLDISTPSATELKRYYASVGKMLGDVE